MAQTAEELGISEFEAPSPANKDEVIKVAVDLSVISKLSRIGWTHKLYALYYNILGYPPPTNNVGYHEKNSIEKDDSKGIFDTHAVFQGLKRPHIDEDGDKSVLIYILRPRYVYKYEVHMACTAKRHPFPSGAVFAVYMKLTEDGKTGEIFNWEFVKSGADDPSLPEDFNNRYDQQRW